MQENPLIQQGTTFTVLGLGLSGMAALRYALACGARIRISDQADKKVLLQKIDGLGLDDCEIEAGGHSFDFLADSDMVFVSPGAECSDLLEKLREKGVQLVGELSLAAAVELPPVIGITGTNGKTTVTSLIGKLIAAGGKEVYVGGNIGYPLLDYLRSGKKADYLVLELSSFQLEQRGDFAPHIGLLLNITPDHLDRHGDMVGYRNAKMALFTGQEEHDYALVYGDDSFCTPDSVKSSVLSFGRSKECPIHVQEHSFSFTINGYSENYSLLGSPFATTTGALNAAPASFVARLAGVAKEKIEQVLKGFDLGEHRMELCGLVNGVSYYNDSKATNTGAVISGLSQLGETVLIAGGKDKGDDYSLLRESVAEKVTELILIGEATPLIADALQGVVPIYEATSLENAMDYAYEKATDGQSVLFAPACSSFDMFANYKDRGEQFKLQVQRLESGV